MTERPQKSFTNIECPHCKKNFAIMTNIFLPFISSVLKDEDIRRIKDTIILNLDEIHFKNEIEKRNTIEMINRKDNVFEESDIEFILKQIESTQIE